MIELRSKVFGGIECIEESEPIPYLLPLVATVADVEFIQLQILGPFRVLMMYVVEYTRLQLLDARLFVLVVDVHRHCPSIIIIIGSDVEFRQQLPVIAIEVLDTL